MFELFQLLNISYQQTRSPWPFPSPGYPAPTLVCKGCSAARAQNKAAQRRAVKPVEPASFLDAAENHAKTKFGDLWNAKFGKSRGLRCKKKPGWNLSLGIHGTSQKSNAALFLQLVSNLSVGQR